MYCIKICDKKSGLKWMIYQVVNILLRKIFKTLRKKRFKTSILRSDLCDYSDAYIVVKEKMKSKSKNESNFTINNNKTTASKSFEYKTKII